MDISPRLKAQDPARLHDGCGEIGSFASPAAPDWLVWQLADSAFPTGGFAHSAGLEAAWQQGEIRSRDELASYLEANLQQAGTALLPFLNDAFRNSKILPGLDELCNVFTSNHVANRASRTQGKALAAAAERIFSISKPQLEYFHYPVVFGHLMHELSVDLTTGQRLFLFMQLRTLASSAVRLGIIGPTEAQQLQFNLTPTLERVLKQCAKLTATETSQVNPLIEILQSAQDRLYSRLFQS